MDISNRNARKSMSFKRTMVAFVNSWHGFIYAFKHEQSMVLITIAIFIAIIGGVLLSISTTEWLFLILILGLMASMEFINTAIEATVDLVTEKFHPLAKIAKDTASAAECCLMIAGIIGGMIIFLPKIINLF